MTSVIFVRHGESETNVHIHRNPTDPDLSKKIDALGDPELSELGCKQAQAVGKYLENALKDQKVRVLTSQFTRTNQTAEPFMNSHGNIEVHQKLDCIQEYTKPSKKLTDEHKDKGIIHHRSWNHFTDIMDSFVDLLEFLAQSNDAPIVVFGHSLYFSVLVSYLASGKRHLPRKQDLIFRFPNCSITSMQYSQGSWRIFNVASLAHIPRGLITGTECKYGHTLQ